MGDRRTLSRFDSNSIAQFMENWHVSLLARMHGSGHSLGSRHLAEPPRIDRSIGKEPAYQTKQPRYALLAFGPEGKDRVWLAWDGDTLYCDRNGNGDLTDPGEKVAAKKPKPGIPQEEGSFDFEIGELTIGGRTHKGLGVSIGRLSYYQRSSIAKRPDVKAGTREGPERPGSYCRARGGGPRPQGRWGRRTAIVFGRVLRPEWALQFAAKPADAPIIHFGGPLEITFFADCRACASIAEPISFSWSARRESAPARLRCSPTWTQFPKTSSRWPKSLISPPSRERSRSRKNSRSRSGVEGSTSTAQSRVAKKAGRRYCHPHALVR